MIVNEQTEIESFQIEMLQEAEPLFQLYRHLQPSCQISTRIMSRGN
jgi:hypothetical protein